MRSLVLAFAAAVFSLPAVAAPTFSVSFPAAMSAQPIDGHITLIVAKGATAEPRTLISEGSPLKSPALFGVTVDGLKPGAAATVDAKAFGWPLRSLSLLPAGDYTVQAVLNRYETFHLADGRVLKLPPDMGEGQHWNEKPGNLYSKAVKIHVDAARPATVMLTLDQKIGPITPKADTPFIKHIRIKSELLSKYWGRPVYLGAHVLLPFGFDTHPNAHYPLMVNHGHFPDDLDGFRTTPPDPNLKPDYSERFRLAGYNRIQQQEAYGFYKKWISPNFPRYLVIEIQHANPYYDDSYAVNSANLGPYGDAINKELIPYIEKKFRGLGQGWVRFTYGGSTGGWEALATQVFYPDMYNGAFVACPDPIDFHAYETINLYDEKTPMPGRASSTPPSFPPTATTTASCSPPSATRIMPSWPRATVHAPAGNTISGKQCSLRSARMDIPSRSLIRSVAISTRASRRTGASIMT